MEASAEDSVQFICSRHYNKKVNAAGKRKRSTVATTESLEDSPPAKALEPATAKKLNTTNKIPTQITAPQLEFVDGRMVVRESSLVIGVEPNLILEEGEQLNPATYSSYRARAPKANSPWGVDETRCFYNALRQVGQDFSLMQTFIPGRTRKQLKKKFFSEDKNNPDLIKAALNSRIPIDSAVFIKSEPKSEEVQAIKRINKEALLVIIETYDGETFEV